MPTQIDSKWEREFLEHFGVLFDGDEDIYQGVIDFIRTEKQASYTQGRESAVEEVREKIKEFLQTPEYNKRQTYEIAIKEVISLLQNIKSSIK